MADSLQDQLMKAGLADEKRARDVRKEQKGKHKQKQPKKRRGQSGPDSATERARREQAEKVERDRQIETKRQARQRAKETAAQIHQIAESHRVERTGGEAVYRFTRGRRIKEVQVTEAQRQQLAGGELAIIAAKSGFELVPASVAERIRGIDENAVAVANERHRSESDAEDPYADFPVPDDLVW